MSASSRSSGASSFGELRRVVLTVAVESHRDVVALLERVPEARLHGCRRSRG